MSEREQETVHEEEIFVKALFFDIDGTLLSEITKEIPQSALDALKKTAEKGNLTFINTGRTWSAARGAEKASVFRISVRLRDLSAPGRRNPDASDDSEKAL